MENLPLFDDGPPPFRIRLAARLAELARDGVYFGTSSWKYEGWVGQIYTAERYLQRGRFSQKRFEATCLAEYAEVFPAVCGDFSFYQFPTAEYWQRLFASAPRSLKFAFKAPEEITVRTWPRHPRYGARGGRENESFLDAHLFERMFVDLLDPWRDQVAVFIFEFGTFPRTVYEGVDRFLQDLDRFLGALPPGHGYAVEIRNPEFLGPEYFGCLRSHRVAHVFNAWTRMPELGVQIALPGAWTADFSVTRALLRTGRAYEQAVDRFQPYRQVQEINERARGALRQIAARTQSEKKRAYVFVNNRLEGNAPGTIAAVLGVEE